MSEKIIGFILDTECRILRNILAGRSRKQLDILGLREEAEDGIIPNFCIPLFKQTTEWWLRYL